jgi:hypothetical protein
MDENRGYIPMSETEALQVARACDSALAEAQGYFEILKDQALLNDEQMEALKVEADVFRKELRETVTEPMFRALHRKDQTEAKRGE